MHSHEQLLARAWKHSDAGEIAQAEALCLQIVREDAQHAEAWTLLGLLTYNFGNLEGALQHFDRAITAGPTVPAYHSNRGAVLQRLGRMADAEAAYREALRLQPRHADAHNNLCVLMRARGPVQEAEAQCRLAVQTLPDDASAHNNLGLILFDQKKFEESIEHFREALSLRPNHHEACNSLGHILAEQDKQEAAEEQFRRAVELAPTNAEYHSNLSVVLQRRGQLKEAEAEGREAVRLQPNSPEALNSLGNTFGEQGKAEEALALFRRALELKPNFAHAINNLGNALTILRRHDEAIAYFRRALELLPDFADAWNNLGNALGDLGRLDEAETCLRHAIKLKPTSPEAYDNLGKALLDQGRTAEALASFGRALEVKPDFVQAHSNRALVRLLTGDYEHGWTEYEWRWKGKGFHLPTLPQPLWNGEPLEGRTILLHPEQGLGDTIQFVRYAAFLKERGATVVLHCPRRLQAILRSCPGIDRLVSVDSDPPPFDFHIPLLSLPRLFGTTVDTIPAPIPYLAPDPTLVQHWRERLSAIPGFKVGIAWQGDAKYFRDRQRSVRLRLFEPLARVPGVSLISLQKGPGTEQVAVCGFALENWGPTLDEQTGPFMDTAALLTCLDLVVTVDTAVVHLAGALGVEAWLAQTFTPHWPWLLDHDVSPWYPTVRLFRQRHAGEWGDVFARLADELTRRMAMSSGPKPVLVEVAPGELLDKISILEIKTERLHDPAKLHNTRIELEELTRARDQALPTLLELPALARELKQINEQLWEVEDALRDLERERDFGPRFIELARSVYKTNDRRAAVKKQINELLGSRIIEEKSYTKYE